MQAACPSLRPPLRTAQTAVLRQHPPLLTGQPRVNALMKPNATARAEGPAPAASECDPDPLSCTGPGSRLEQSLSPGHQVHGHVNARSPRRDRVLNGGCGCPAPSSALSCVAWARSSAS